MAKAPPCAKPDHGVLLVFGAPGGWDARSLRRSVRRPAVRAAL